MAIKARRDKNALTLFDNANGTKVRLALGKYTKAKRPELVDIKITDYCAFGCDFCYQGSTLQGKHATYENMQTVIQRLKKAKVFEVACLEKSTKVLTPQGMQEIGKLKVGDKVVESSGEEKEIVNKIISRKETIKLTCSNGFEITATPDHPFIIKGEIVEAINTLGLALDTSKNTETPVVTKISKNKIEEVVDITLEDNSTHIFQLEYGVLSHNCGGGEPTDHPDFIQIMKDFHDAGIVPNFTTRSLGWVKRHWDEIEPYVGAFAYSADNIHHLDAANKMFEDIPHDRINIHYIMGLQDEKHFVGFMKRAYELDFRVTLLGYKTTGRGKNVIPVNYDFWIDAVNFLLKMGCCPTFSIDTPLAEQYDGKMPVNKTLYHTREGFVSAYIDAVAMTMGASSFDEKEILVPFDADWLKRYKQL